MTPDVTILKMLGEVEDLRVVRADLWAKNFGRTTEEMERLVAIVAQERQAVAA